MVINIELLILALLLSIGFNLFFNKVFIKQKKIDQINSRSSHNVLATKTGGIAFFSSLFTISLLLYFTRNEIFDFSLLIPLSIIFFVGVYDDFYDADFKLKFFFQIIVAKLLIDNGFIVNNLNGIFGLFEINHILAQFITVFIFLLLVNAFNFIDGIDGLAFSFSIFSLLCFGYLNFKSPLTNLNFIVVATLIPLYYFNFKKNNKIFLGDAGSLLLGSIVSINSIHFLNPDQITLVENRALTLILILFYPLVDIIRVIILRLYNKKSPFTADKNHLHHLLLMKFKKHFFVTFFIVLINLILFILIY